MVATASRKLSSLITSSLTKQLGSVASSHVCSTSRFSTTPIKIEAEAGKYFRKIMQLGTAGSSQEIKKLGVKMKERGLYTEESFGKFVDSLERKLESKQVLQLLELVEKDCSGKFPLPPLVINFLVALLDEKIDHNNVMLYLCKHDRPDLAFDIFQRMDRGKLFSLKTLAFQELILGLCETKWVEKCVRVLDEMFGLGHTPYYSNFYTTVIPFMSKANEPYKVVKLLELMIDDMGFQPEQMDVDTDGVIMVDDIYEDTVIAFCHLWKFDDAASFVLQRNLSYSSDILLRRYCCAGMFDEAIDFHEKMIGNGRADISSWVIFVKALWEEGELEKSFEFFKRMLSWIHTSHDQSCEGNDNSIMTGERASKDGGVLTFEKFKMLINGLFGNKLWTIDCPCDASHLFDSTRLQHRLKQDGWLPKM